MTIKTKPSTRLASTRFTAALERRVLRSIRKHDVFVEGERVIAAVSGGPDSTALLVVLSRLRAKLSLDITVAHFDHRLRTRAGATSDLEFVRSLTSALDLPLVHGSGDTRAHAAEYHLSIEDAARRLRYGFLGEEASRRSASVIAVGHTLDDQAETVLLHLIRGSGLTGFAAMPARAPWPFGEGPAIARPLIALRREETQRYCRELGLEPIVDPTNELPIANRNRVRHELLPVLRRLNPRIEESLARFARSAAADDAYLDDLARHAFHGIAEPGGTGVTLSRRDLALLPTPLAARVIRLAFAQIVGTSAGLESTHIEAVLDALEERPVTHSLPEGVIATLDQSSLTFSRGRLPKPDSILEVSLIVPGPTAVGSWLIGVSLAPPPASAVAPDRLEAYLDAGKAGPILTVRSRRPGDRLRPLGLGGEKKLQDILVDAKVPARDRDAVPLVCSGDQIAWVIGHCIDERFAITEATRQVVHLTACLDTPNET
jgi:tRNA(Ile)-lysidine synthase